MRDLRHGVKLKKTNYTKTPVEYELTPYEILMDDIRSKRYKLRKVTADRCVLDLCRSRSTSHVVRQGDGGWRDPTQGEEGRARSHPGVHPVETATETGKFVTVQRIGVILMLLYASWSLK